MLKNPRRVLFFIILLTLLTLIIDLPRLKVKGKTFSHPTINTKIIKRDLEPRLGLDLSCGVQVVMSLDMSKLEQNDKDSAAESAKNIIENRINSLGVSEPVIQTAKTKDQYRLVIELAGISDIDQAISTIKKTAHLEFKTDGAKKFEEITKNNLEKPVAIFLDNELISAPTVQAVIADGNAQITGQFTSSQAKQLAIALNAGALPVPLKIESQTRIGPTIGTDSIQKSLLATAVGLASVAIFMIFYYRILGMFAVLALVIYSLIVFAIFKLIPVTLTLAGIAGFVLSIGMAVDANILIFERIKEEVRWGKPKLESLFAGFDRAWSSIRDSNISSLITCAILFNFGTGQIRGFALTLAIGILLSMFSAITVTRTFLRIFWVKRT